MSEEVKLPKGWCWATISMLANSMKNGIYKAREFYATSGIPCLRMYNIDDGRLILHDLKFLRLSADEVEEYGLAAGDVLVNRVNSRELVGKACVIPEGIGSLVFESKNIRLRLNPILVNPKYINFCLLHCGRAYFNGNAQQTVGMASVNQEQLGSFPVPLAPRREQDRIIEKSEELLSDLDAGVAALERARANLKKYRAAVLRAAVTGELTAEWRAAHPNVEPATELLERILADRRRKWEEKPDSSDLPPGWCWAKVGQLGVVQLGRQRSPKNRSNKYPTKYIRAANIKEDGLAIDDLLDMEFTPSEQETYRLQVGDIILSEASGSPDQVGKPAVWNDEVPNCCFQNKVIRLRPEQVNNRYLLVVFQHFYFNKIFARVAAGVGINHLSAAKFSALTVPLPRADEQPAIVAEIEQRLSVIDATENYLAASLKRAARLRQSILKEAFAGRLVPQDPTDEPASVLLERLRAERQTGIIDKAKPARNRRASRNATPKNGERPA